MGTIMYCKARGMPFDHVDDNAILAFCGNCNDGKIHGAELECNYAACRAQGPKFRYCGFCKSAVSKRNFRKRHAHGMLFSKKRTPHHFTTPFDQESVQSPLERKRSRVDPTNNECLQVISSSNISSIENMNNSACSRIFAAPSPIKTIGAIYDRSHVPFSAKALCQGDSMKDVPEDWDLLYRKRPRTGDADGIKSWLIAALNIAGLGSHCPSSNPVETKNSTANCWFYEDSELDPLTIKNDLTSFSIFPNCSPGLFPNGTATPPLHNDEERNMLCSSQHDLPKYKMFADSLSLHIETDGIGIGNLSDVLPLDSDGSMIRI